MLTCRHPSACLFPLAFMFPSSSFHLAPLDDRSLTGGEGRPFPPVITTRHWAPILCLFLPATPKTCAINGKNYSFGHLLSYAGRMRWVWSIQCGITGLLLWGCISQLTGRAQDGPRICMLDFAYIACEFRKTIWCRLCSAERLPGFKLWLSHFLPV